MTGAAWEEAMIVNTSIHPDVLACSLRRGLLQPAHSMEKRREFSLKFSLQMRSIRKTRTSNL
jgi:hypothetical protein